MFTVNLMREARFDSGVVLPPGLYDARSSVDLITGAPAVAVLCGPVELLVPLRYAHRYFKGWGELSGSAPAIPGL